MITKRLSLFYLLFFFILFSSTCVFGGDEKSKLVSADVQAAQKITGLEFTPSEIDSMLSLLSEQLGSFETMRKMKLANDVPPAFHFNPIPQGKTFSSEQKPFKTSDYSRTVMPAHPEDLAYYSIGELAFLVRSKKISSVKLTGFFLDRLKRFAPQLHCVVTFTDSLAMQQARQADADLAAGHYHGLLHGIPFGIKDMFATKNIPTTYGTPPYKDQLINKDATVVKKLREAGAVLLAKLSLGELAMDDVWFGGQTRNPWDTSKGSSGSSAGPAAAVSAGLVPFAIGSETLGSIVSPANRCGVTGLRPSFGRVSRSGAMALSWTMDKVGPLCRNAEDCSIVFNAIYGVDGKDESMVDLPFNYNPEISWKGLKVGYFKKDFEQDTLKKSFNDAALETLRNAGAQLVPLELPKLPLNDMVIILLCEAASAFDDLTLKNLDDAMVQQNKDNWPNIFRAAHFIPATEYIRASRLRWLLVQQMDSVMQQVDVCIAPPFGENLLATNFTGNPAVVVPNGFMDPKTPTSIVFIGQLFDEGRLIAVAKKYQELTGFHLKHPPGFSH